ncbi:hypothetical protein BH10ACT2_BH10ACT2_28590 [soil metagenome]
MAAVLTAFHLMSGDGELVTTEQIDVTYSHIPADVLQRNFVIIEHDVDGVVGYGRTDSEETPEGLVHFWLAPIYPQHLSQQLLTALVAGLERRAAERAAEAPGIEQSIRCWMDHPGPEQPVDGTPVAWLEATGYRVVRFEASMVHPNLDNIPLLSLPSGVEVCPVAPEQLRAIWDAHSAAFAGSFGQQEATEEQWLGFRDDPIADPTLWKIAWSGDQVVGQIRSYINHQENETLHRLRGYTEQISTHADWRGRGVASALLSLSLCELRDRGMTEAALGVDTENPANAFAIYERLGFQRTAYIAVMGKPLTL